MKRSEQQSQATGINRLAETPIALHGSLRSVSGTVLVPLDGSMAAEHALPMALALAQRSGSNVHAVHVYSPFDLVSNDLQRLGGGDVLRRIGYTRKKLAYLEAVRKHVNSAYGVEIDVSLVEDVDTAGALRKMTRAGDLAVLALRNGHCPWVDAAHSWAQRLSGPCLVVPSSNGLPGLGSDPAPSEVIIATDGSQAAEPMVDLAAGIAKLCDARLTLFQVRSPSKRVQRRDNVEWRLERLTKSFGKGSRIRTCRIDASTRSAAQAIQSLVNSIDGAMLALASCPRGPLARLLWPSLADSMVGSLKRPLLLQSCQRA